MKKRLLHIIPNTLKKTTALVLAVLVLTSSLGVPLYKQTCLMKGEEKVSIFQAQEIGCCKKEEHQTHHHNKKTNNCDHQSDSHLALKPIKCCDLTIDLVKAEIQANALDSKKFDKAFQFALIDELSLETSWLFAKDYTTKYFYTDTSPPISGRTLIIRKQSFLL